MKVVKELNEIRDDLKDCVVTIGNFDGFHLGHRELISKTVKEAQSLGVPSVVMTFTPHPFEVLNPGAPFLRIFDEDDQIEVLSSLGVSALVLVEFTSEFSKLSPADFFEKVLYQKLKPQMLVLGFDFHFGQDRKGDLHFLEHECQKYHISLVIIPPFEVSGEKASSTRVRNFLEQGRLEEVQKILLRPYYLKGIVEKGFQRGQKELVRTVNLKTSVPVLLKQGVYVSRVSWQDKTYESVTNVGLNPTFEHAGDKIKVETHLLGQSLDLYDQKIKVEFLKFIRDEKKFSTVQELKEQIQKDIQTARGYFEKEI